MTKENSRIILPMDEGWLFQLGDVTPHPIDPRSVYAFHCMSKSNRGRGAAAPAWDDRDWERVTLPHDYVINEKPDPRCFSAQGSLPRKNAWYRMHFRLDEKWIDRRAALEFDGVATKCVVWVNGHLVKRHYGAYDAFEADFTDVARYGKRLNTVAVQVLTDESEGWWYEGGGIYRHARLVLSSQQHIARYGVWVNPERAQGASWNVPVETTLQNDAYEEARVELVSSVVDERGNTVVSGKAVCEIAPRAKAVVQTTMRADAPLLWSPKEAHLYTLVSKVYRNGELIDDTETRFGFRELRFSPDGMTVNGEIYKIYGGCVHEDYGALGVAMPDSLKEYRLREMMKMGLNGIRCSHNQQSAEQFDACDRLGLMVMAETRWFESYGEGLEQLKQMIRRDRNHPSIFFWSLGNEEPTQRSRTGKRIMRAMRAEVRKLDPSRPCVLSMNTGLLDDGAAEYNDVIGMNYNEDKFEQVHKLYPDRAIVGTEMYSTSLDPEGDRPLGLFTCEMLEKLNYLVGIYIWTGMDYRGEHIYPTIASNAGAIDLNCRPRDDFYLYQAMWTKEPMARIHTHWNHKPGERVKVYAYTNLDTAELFLNGKSLGEKRVAPFDPPTWELPFEAGELRVKAAGGGKTAEHAVRTAGKAAYVKLQNRFQVAEDTDAVVINLTVFDVDGNPCLTSADMICFSVEGGELLGACNGDICDYTLPRETRRRLYEGFCQIVIRPLSGAVVVRARLDGAEGEEALIRVDTSAHRRKPGLESLDTRYVTGWRMGGVCESRPDSGSLDAKDWTRMETDIATSWSFFDCRTIDCGRAKIDAYVPYRAQTTVPDGATELFLGAFWEGTQIEIRREGEKKARWVLEGAGEENDLVFSDAALKPGDRLVIDIILYAKYSGDGLNHSVYWR